MKQTNLQRRRLLTTLVLSSLVGSTAVSAQTSKGSHITMRFELPGISGNPFDFLENDIQVELAGPGNRRFVVPAFFSGGTTWEIRCTPPAGGTWSVKQITRNAKPAVAQNIQPKQATFDAKTGNGFIRRDAKDPGYFAYENGMPYYPIGCNAAWNSGGVTVEDFLTLMQTSGQNWARIWMNHWDQKNLDWVPDKKIPLGQLDLDVAKRWDGIVDTAERANIAFQMVFQHHGQYSTQVNPNWDDNPWSTKNGGFLEKPEEFFTNEQARRLTQAKYRYIIARWGYSPHILAWELFNEVQFTDTARQKKYDQVAAWHREMAAFVRKHDVHRHLVTTSSDENITGLFDVMDYRQPHAYPSDVVSTIRTVGDQFRAAKANDNGAKQPVFLGEIGTGVVDLSQDDGTYLHQILWSGIMTPAPGAAQYWTWDNVYKRKIVDQWKPATDFVRVFRLAGRRAMVPVALSFTEASQSMGSTSFGPGGGWGETKQTRYVVAPSGDVAGIGAMSPYLQGDNNRALFPFAEFAVQYDKPGTFAVHIRQISKGGANVQVKVDGAVKAEKSFAGGNAETNTRTVLSVPVPAGAHTVRLENTGMDWANIEKITLTPYGAPARAVAKADTESVAAWIYAPDPVMGAASLTMTVSVPNLTPGKYQVFWWDTKTGKTLRTETVDLSSGTLSVKTPPITADIALFAAHERTGKYSV